MREDDSMNEDDSMIEDGIMKIFNKIEGGTYNSKQSTNSKKKDVIVEGQYYVMPTKIRSGANIGVIKSFFSGRIQGEVTIVDTMYNCIVLLFSNDEDVAQYTMVGWEEEIMEFLQY